MLRWNAILTAEEMRSVDASTFSRLGISSRTVMESAGRSVASVILQRYSRQIQERGVVVLCGGGNNGGDGYVVARTLANLGVAVTVISTASCSSLSGDAAQACSAWMNSGGMVAEADGLVDYSALLSAAGVVVDAIYGTGFAGVVNPIAGSLIRQIRPDVPVVSVDLPSGVNATTGVVAETAVRASVTVALQFLKRGHLLFPAAGYCGALVLVDIGISLAELPDSNKGVLLVSRSEIASLLRARFFDDPRRHKGGRGHVLVVGGGAGHYGAPKLSGLGALRAGAGLVTVVAPVSGAVCGVADVLELMVDGCSEDSNGDFSSEAAGDVRQRLEGKDALVIGPGLGTGEGAHRVFFHTVEHALRQKLPIVVDADGLNILAGSSSGFAELIGPGAVLTPHPGEMARLLGVSVAEVERDRFESARELARRGNCVVVLKGANSVTADPGGGLFVNPFAGEILGTAGSGDVLAGVIGALVGRGYSNLEGTLLGVYLHSMAGALLQEGGGLGIVATEISGELPVAMNRLFRGEDLDRVAQELLCGGREISL